MSESNDAIIEIDKMSVDQLAGAVVLILGAIGSLLLVIWQSKCHCKVNLCYIFSCERRPPNEDEMKSLKDLSEKQAKKLKEVKRKGDGTAKEDKILEKEEEILDNQSETSTPRLVPKSSMEPLPEPEMDKLV